MTSSAVILYATTISLARTYRPASATEIFPADSGKRERVVHRFLIRAAQEHCVKADAPHVVQPFEPACSTHLASGTRSGPSGTRSGPALESHSSDANSMQ
eukprot:2369850-Rhodomonas_salina.2